VSERANDIAICSGVAKGSLTSGSDFGGWVEVRRMWLPRSSA